MFDFGQDGFRCAPDFLRWRIRRDQFGETILNVNQPLIITVINIVLNGRRILFIIFLTPLQQLGFQRTDFCRGFFERQVID